MTWVTSERGAAAASSDGKYQVRPHGGEYALFQSGLGRPLMVGSPQDCRGLAEALESDAPLEELPPLRGRAAPDPRLDAVHALAARVARSGARMAVLRGAAAPAPLLSFELSILRRLSAALMQAVDTLEDPR